MNGRSLAAYNPPVRRLPALIVVLALLPSIAHAQPRCDDPAGAIISSVEFVGLGSAPEADIRSALAVEPGSTVGPLALTRLEDRVLATGWFESASVVISSSSSSSSPSSEGGCVLRVRVREYPPVTEIRFPDVRAYDRGAALVSMLEIQPGRPANRAAAERDGARIVERYQEDGYEAARYLDADIDGGIVTFRIAEGRIVRIDVVGAKRTGARRVRQVLGVKKGDLYNAIALIRGQTALYRTGLFSLVGYGVEPVDSAGAAGDLVLTVNVGEIDNPFSRTDVLVDREQTATGIEARIRNVGAGHSMHSRFQLLGPSAGRLAEVGFDEFYRAEALAEVRLFRPNPTSEGGRVGVGVERVRGRVREDLGLTFDSTLASLRVGADVPVMTGGPGLTGVGTFTALAGWRLVDVSKPALAPDSGAWGRGEVGFELERVSGFETPARLTVRGGVEMNAGEHPFSYLEGEGSYQLAIARGHRIEARAEAANLSGRRIPYWRERVVGGPDGPLAVGPEHAFARQYAHGRLAYVASMPRDLLGAALGYDGAVWGGAAGEGKADDAQSGFVEVRAGPPFARIRAGVAVPVDGRRDRAPWWFAGVTIASPY